MCILVFHFLKYINDVRKQWRSEMGIEEQIKQLQARYPKDVFMLDLLMISGYFVTSVCTYVSWTHPTDTKVTTFLMKGWLLQFLDSNYDSNKGKLCRLQTAKSTSGALEPEKDALSGHSRICRI